MRCHVTDSDGQAIACAVAFERAASSGAKGSDRSQFLIRHSLSVVGNHQTDETVTSLGPNGDRAALELIVTRSERLVCVLDHVCQRHHD